MGQLDDFAPPSLLEACALLQKGQNSPAASLFRKTLAQNPTSYVAYVGLSQAEPAFRLSEINRLEGIARQRHETPVEKFQLGLQLYYKWRMQTEQQNREQKNAPLAQATDLLNQSWQETGQSLAAKLLIEIDYDIAPQRKTARMIDEAVQRLAGPKAYAAYRKAQSSHWNTATPPTSLTPRQNLQGLRGILGELWSFQSIRIGEFTIKSGKAVITKMPPISPEKVRAQDYIERWRKAIKAAL